MASTTLERNAPKTAATSRSARAEQGQSDCFARFKACVDACLTTSPNDDALWCIADCDVALRSSLGRQLNTDAPDPMASLGTAALLLPYVTAHTRSVASPNGDTHHNTDQTVPVTLNGNQASVDPPVRTPGIWSRVVTGLAHVPSVLDPLDKIGTFGEKYGPDARATWSFVVPTILSVLTIVIGSVRTFVFGDEKPECNDCGFGAELVGGGSDLFTLALVAGAIAFAVGMMLSMVFSETARAFLASHPVGKALRILMLVVLLVAFVRAAIWGFEEPYRWVDAA
jgi:hypothetical protein